MKTLDHRLLFCTWAKLYLAGTLTVLASLSGLGQHHGPALEARLVTRPLSLQEIRDLKLPEDTRKSGGLATVGLGEPAYLEILTRMSVDATNPVVRIVWSLAQKPSGSVAELQASPLGPTVPAYSVADRLISNVADRTLLVPDRPGAYVVTATITRVECCEGENEVLTARITGATYVGVGGIEGAAPTGAQCARCHTAKANSWNGTQHGDIFARAIDGVTGGNSAAFENLVLGYNPAPGAANGGFDDAARQLGWTFPTHGAAGNWLALPQSLKNLSNVQCESCHGPGSEHVGQSDKTSVSFNTGACAYCHDQKPEQDYNRQWELSKHAAPHRHPSEMGSPVCAQCHSGKGFVDFAKGKALTETRVDYEPLGCATCHDPHAAGNPHQVRVTAQVKLGNGVTVQGGGAGRLCMNCHKGLRDASGSYVSTYSSHFGPHLGPQTDMLAGANAVDYGQSIPSSGHLRLTGDSCVTCHMQSVAESDPANNHAGGHTFGMVWDSGTPGDIVDDKHLTGVCSSCHGEMESFNIRRVDYDADGVIEGFQTEVKGLLAEVATLLPPLGSTNVVVTTNYTASQLKAAFNYQFVRDDGSFGIHNPSYAVGILKASLADLRGELVTPGDTDKDGLPDVWEVASFGNTTAQNATGDADGDGLTNGFEFRLGCNPTLCDSDRDGFDDGSEIELGNDPTNAQDNPDLVVRMFQAAEFVFATRPGETYQIQTICQLGGTWTNVGGTVAGTGGTMSHLIPTRSKEKAFFRVVKVQ